MQPTLEGPVIQQRRLEAPPIAPANNNTNARVFTITREDMANMSNVVTSQIYIFNRLAKFYLI